MNLLIAITMGDVAGIGPEIVAKTFSQRPDLTQGCFIAGDLEVVRGAASLVSGAGAAIPTALISRPADALLAPPRCLPVLQVARFEGKLQMGRISAAAGRFAGDCVVAASGLALSGDVAAIVTAPLNKEALSSPGSPYAAYPGHTELLQAEAAKWRGQTLESLPVRMMLVNQELRVVLASIHVPLREALAAITFENVRQTLEITHRALTGRLGRAPRIAVAGLNPHAGEAGMFGTEEISIIAPAVAAARDSGVDAFGPYAPDTVFMRARSVAGQGGEFDVVIAMYHDQGLIPIKYLGLDHGVNVTLGLPYVRTSPDHGTAFDLAGKGQARADSFIAALTLARDWAGRS